MKLSLVFALALVACSRAGASAAPSDQCPELRGDFPTYAFSCSADARQILYCTGDAGQITDCNATQLVVGKAVACSCDSLTTCSESTQEVVCVKVDAGVTDTGSR